MELFNVTRASLSRSAKSIILFFFKHKFITIAFRNFLYIFKNKKIFSLKFQVKNHDNFWSFCGFIKFLEFPEPFVSEFIIL